MLVVWTKTERNSNIVSYHRFSKNCTIFSRVLHTFSASMCRWACVRHEANETHQKVKFLLWTLYVLCFVAPYAQYFIRTQAVKTCFRQLSLAGKGSERKLLNSFLNWIKRKSQSEKIVWTFFDWTNKKRDSVKLNREKEEKSKLMYQASTLKLIRFHRLQDRIKCVDRN